MTFILFILLSVTHANAAATSACAGALTEPQIVKRANYRDFQKKILDNFEKRHGVRLSFDVGPFGALLLVDPKGEIISSMGYQVRSGGTRMNFGLIETPMPWHRKQNLTEALFAEVLLRNPKLLYERHRRFECSCDLGWRKTPLPVRITKSARFRIGSRNSSNPLRPLRLL